MADDSFDPPSDFEGGSGGSGTSIWMWAGIGCAAILLLSAALVIIGGYQGYTCCRKAMKRQEAARKTALQFAYNLRDRKYGAAWSQTTDDFQDTSTKEEFQKRVEPYRTRIDQSVPELVGFRRSMGQKNGGSWKLDVGFMPHAGDTYVVMRLELEKWGKGENLEFLVDRIEFDEKQRDVAAEPPARQVRRFNKLLAEEKFQQARDFAADSYEPAKSNSSLQTFVEDHDPVLGAERIEFVSLKYSPGATAVVRAAHHTGSAEPTYVDYQVAKKQGTWRIAGIDVGVEPPKPSDEGGETPDTGDAGDTSSDASSPDGG